MATLSKFVGDVVLGNVGSSDLGYCFEEIIVTYAANMDVGSVVNSSGVWIAKAAAANTYGVIVDMKAKNLDGKLTVGATFPCVVAVRGTSFKGSKVLFTDGAIDTAGKAPLEAKGCKFY